MGIQSGSVAILTSSAYADMVLPMKVTARIFKALSDETRLRIVALLCRGELCVCDLMAILDLPQSTVSRHLATLRHVGLVEDRRQGVWMYYRLAASEPLHQDLVELLEKHSAGISQVEKDRAALAKFQDQGKACG
jgi:ArsR family transcriptional regulator, arsenate/arsenite/antimonite-responsive transcriptional repressor